MMDSDIINNKYWASVPPEKILAGLSFPGPELLNYLKKGDSILDVGCGTGKVSNYLDEKGYKITGIDLNEKALEENHQRNANIIYKVADVTTRLPFENSSFDAIIVSYVFVSIIAKEKQKLAAEEIKRVLKKGGYLWLCEATYSPEYIERYKLGKDLVGEDLIALSLDNEGHVKRIIRHYKEEDLDILFNGLLKLDSSNLVVQSPSSGMCVESLRIVYQK
jgi:ubiquinone/menaquinone biosynthesis C-methylase UbiE